MRSFLPVIALPIALFTSAPAGAQSPPPLYDDLGSHQYEISTRESRSQSYFNQGLRLYYAFNHAEAIRAFNEAERLDPTCAMCAWGEALARGPNINLPMDSENALAAHAAVERAQSKQSGSTPRERDLIAALARRYSADAPEDRASLDSAYARAMEALVDRYPSDDEILVLYGEALMDLRPWDYWVSDDRLEPSIARAVELFSEVRERAPNHPGACHFFIHAVEENQPDRAVPCAEHLAGMMPGAGHLVHMPGHIYIRVGRYDEAIEANRHAVHADESFIRDQRPDAGMYTLGYYPHNYDFLAFAAMMSGRRDAAVEAADKMAELIPEEMFGTPGMGFLEHWSMRRLQMRVRFGAWDEILAVAEPRADLAHARALWHYARGRAFAATGRAREAGMELDGLRREMARPQLEGVRLEFNPARSVLAVAEDVLGAWVASAEGDQDRAVRLAREAVAHENDLLYGEPPEWSVPARQDLGEVLLRAGRLEEARAAFREDLRRFPSNVWSERGLSAASGN